MHSQHMQVLLQVQLEVFFRSYFFVALTAFGRQSLHGVGIKYSPSFAPNKYDYPFDGFPLCSSHIRLPQPTVRCAM